MNTKLESEIIAEDEINLYDYWKVLVKRKKIFIGIFLVPLAIVTIISLSLPHYHRGESEIIIPALPATNIPSVITAPNIVKLMGEIDDYKKDKIFTRNPDAIKSFSISISEKLTDRVNIIVDAKTEDIIPQALKDMHSYINMLPEIKEEVSRIQAEADLKRKQLIEENDLKRKNLIEQREKLIAENDLKLPKLIEAKKANLLYLNQITDMMKKGQMPVVNINPADLIRKDADISIEIMNLDKAKKSLTVNIPTVNIPTVKVTGVILGPPSITKQPPNAQIKRRIVITGFLCFFAGIFVVFFLEYIDRMKAYKDK